MSASSTILSKLSIAVGIFDHGVKQFLFNLFQNDSIAAAGSSQATATALSAGVNVVTGADGTKAVVLPPAVDGTSVRIINATANQLLPVYPNGAADVINSLSATTAFSHFGGADATYYCTANGQWYVETASFPIPEAKYTTRAYSSATATAGDLTGAGFVTAANTGATPGSLTTRTAAQMFADFANMPIGGAYKLRIVNAQGTGTLTLAAGSGVTLTGTMTVAANTFRDFNVTFNSATTLTIQNEAVGTFS